ncbi:MAG: hypothetical protein M1113_01635 [Candidatus Thermoplasmatota archaeon]|nr:hypothetical protein [Candidatus Thermoplasmatota archaeon]
MEVTTKQKLTQIRTGSDVDETLKELRDLIFQATINEKIVVNYLKSLEDLANPSKKTFLYEFPIPPEASTPHLTNLERFGLEKPGPIVSNLISLILKNLDLNEKRLFGATDLRKSKIDVLKIE